LKNKKNGNENKESCENLCNLVVRKRKMLKDERGQLSIDFLVGISLFILALLFMAHFIPGMFVPFQSETIDLSSVAYRTSVILVEDPGWWDNGTDSGKDWEKHINDTSRIGLAIDKDHPNIVNMRKKTALNTTITDANLTRTLGLYKIIGDKEIDYGYNITIVDAGNNILVTRGEIPPEYGDVVKMERILSLRVSDRGLMDASNTTGAVAPAKPLLLIDKDSVSKFCNDDLYIYLTNFNFTHSTGSYAEIKITATDINIEPGTKLDYAHGIGLKINVGYPKALVLGDPSDGWRKLNDEPDIDKLNKPLTITNKTDVLKICIHPSAFQQAGINTIDPVDEDIIIQIKLIGIEILRAETTEDILRYTDTEEIAQIPIRLSTQVWT